MTRRDPDTRPRHVAGDGDLPPWWSVLDRRRLAVALGSTLVAVPVVVLDNLPRHHGAEADAQELVVESPTTATTLAAAPSTTVTVLALVATSATTAPPPTTTEAPATTAPPTTARPAPPPPTTAAPPTTAEPPPPTTAAAPVNQESGRATWYRYVDGECAHKTLPRGTVVTVTNVANGATASCVVTDRGPYGGGRIIDLDDGTFSQLAPLSAGVIDVIISW